MEHLKPYFKTPRQVDEKFKGIYSQKRDSLYVIMVRLRLLFLISIIALAALTYFKIFPNWNYTIYAGASYVLVFIISLARKSADKKTNNEGISQLPMSYIGLVQHSNVYGVLVFSTDPSNQQDHQRILDATNKLRALRDSQHVVSKEEIDIQAKLNDTHEWIDTAPLPISIGGEENMYFTTTSVGDNIPENFDFSNQVLAGLIITEKGKYFINLLHKSAY